MLGMASLASPQIPTNYRLDTGLIFSLSVFMYNVGEGSAPPLPDRVAGVKNILRMFIPRINTR